MKINRLILFLLGMSGCGSAMARQQPASVQHVIVYHEIDRFAGWPANRGIWSWGDEIAVGFVRGWFKHDPNEHSRDPDKPAEDVIARSIDGGVTWQIEPVRFGRDGIKPSPGGIEFAHPGFALIVREDVFYVSYDRARTWSGPFAFPDFKLGGDLTARTDYLVKGPSEALFFLSYEDERVEIGMPDRAFAVRTRDGGLTFQRGGLMAGDEPPGVRSVMPATVRADNGTLVTVLRRRFNLQSGYRNDLNWLDVFISRDDGETWGFAARLAHTDHTGHNGNPPSLVRLPDGRLAAAYGLRSKPYGIRARISTDYGLTWGPELVLRDDARTWDIGYCRSVVRADGRIVTVYYYATAEHFENHIAATIWTP